MCHYSVGRGPSNSVSSETSGTWSVWGQSLLFRLRIELKTEEGGDPYFPNLSLEVFETVLVTV